MTEPRWLSRARLDAGLREILGPASEPRILEMAREIGAPAWFHNDDQPWCAVAMNAWLFEEGLPISVGIRSDPFDRLRALPFRHYGQGLAGPALGAIGVFSRPAGAHVGMYLGSFRDLLYVFGGNQKNMVGQTWIQQRRLLEWRWPPGEPLPAVRRIPLAHTGEPVSTNEE